MPRILRLLILGRVVFGTARGLFAKGNGQLSGIEGGPEALEMRNADPRRAISPPPDRPALFRKVLWVSTGNFIDVVGVVNGASDLERRPGFIAYGIAVPSGADEAYLTAFGILTEEFRAALAHYTVAGRFRDGQEAFKLPGEIDRAYRAASYSDAGTKAAVLRLALPDWWAPKNRGLSVDALDNAARWSGSAHATVVISPDEGEGAHLVTEELLDRLAEETLQRRAADRERQKREGAVLEAAALRVDPGTRRLLQKMDGRIRALERQVSSLDARNTHASGDNKRAYSHERGVLAFPHSEIEQSERNRRMLFAGLVAAAFLITIIVAGALTWWLVRGENAEIAAETAATQGDEPSDAERILGEKPSQAAILDDPPPISDLDAATPTPNGPAASRPGDE